MPFTRPTNAIGRKSNLEVKTRADGRERADLAVGHSDMGRVDGIAAQGLGAFQRTVEHDIGIGRIQTAIDVDMDVNQSGNLPFQALQSGLNPLFYSLFFGR